MQVIYKIKQKLIKIIFCRAACIIVLWLGKKKNLSLSFEVLNDKNSCMSYLYYLLKHL